MQAIDNLVERIIQYESGQMNPSEMILFFQELIDTDIVWELQGNYSRVARNLIEDGLCQIKTLTNK